MYNLFKKLFKKRLKEIEQKKKEDSSSGVKYSTTENSEFARTAEKTKAVGIDKFEEDEEEVEYTEVSTEEVSDYRGRIQDPKLADNLRDPRIDEFH